MLETIGATRPVKITATTAEMPLTVASAADR
jgi:hypothetical protein